MYDNKNTNAFDLGILLLRVATSILMLPHGFKKIGMLMVDGPVKFADPLGLGAEITLILVVFAEVFCSFCLIIGYKTRLVTIPLIITMLVAVFITHWNDPFAKQEFALMYLLIYVTLTITGAGTFSLDQGLVNRKKVY